MGNRKDEIFRSGGNHSIQLQAVRIVPLNLAEEGLDDIDGRDGARSEELSQLDTVGRQDVEHRLDCHVGVRQRAEDVEEVGGVVCRQ